MDGIDVGNFSRTDHRRNVQIALRQLRRPDADGLIGKSDMQRIAVGLAVNRDRLDSKFLAGTNHPQGNFTAIGYEDFLEHFRSAHYARGDAAPPKLKIL